MDSGNTCAVAVLTEPIGSIPRPPGWLKRGGAFSPGAMFQSGLLSRYAAAPIEDPVARFEATGSSVIKHSRHAKSGFVTLPQRPSDLLCGRTDSTVFSPDCPIVPCTPRLSIM
jgi:hypothetical protein